MTSYEQAFDRGKNLPFNRKKPPQGGAVIRHKQSGVKEKRRIVKHTEICACTPQSEFQPVFSCIHWSSFLFFSHHVGHLNPSSHLILHLKLHNLFLDPSMVEQNLVHVGVVSFTYQCGDADNNL